MPEGRMLKKAISESKSLGNLSSDSARLLYTWLIPFLDIQGRHSGDPEIIKGHIFPKVKTMTVRKISTLLTELSNAGLVILYRQNDNDEVYLQFTKFKEHQRLDPGREAPSKIPAPTADNIIRFGPTQANSGVNPANSLLSKVNKSKDKLSKDNVEPGSTISKIIEYFNETTGQKRSLSSKETNGLISGRLTEGRTFDDFKHVIDTKTAQWINDPKMRAFIRPSTLFRPGHFEDYLNEPYQDPRRKEQAVGQTPQKFVIPVSAGILHDVRKVLAEEADRKKLDEKKRTELLSSFFYRLNQIFEDPAKVEAWKKVPQSTESLLNFVRGTA
jgi:uncharacterized phage protein (TIGR02220 family)